MSPAETLGVGHVADAAPLFAALGDGTRLELLSRLGAGGPASITRLSRPGAITRQAVSKHLAVLAQAGLVRSTRQGREQVWQLEAQRLADAHRYLELISRQWDDALGRLQAFVEGPATG
jgi:DNA-binding transcriptional ArsR family regulator